jgi:hypothetical protein
MDMPQKEGLQKPIFRGDKRQASVSFLLQGIANMIQDATGRANEPWNVGKLRGGFPRTNTEASREPQFKHRPLIACTGSLVFRSGTTIPK